MTGAQIHYELFIRRTPGAAWVLDMATENRALATKTAEEMMAAGKVAAVKVTKESLNPETREFQSIAIMTLGAAEPSKAKPVREDNEPLCFTPQDLYTVHARDRIGRLLEHWLDRRNATPFELLHRPDLVEELENSGTDLQHAIQKIAIPEAQARGKTVHELMRTFQGLVERAIERILKDSKKGNLPDVDKEGFAKAAERVSREPERAYLLGAGVAASIAPARTWPDKVIRLLDLADAAPVVGPPRGLALGVIEQPLAEILGSRAGLDELIGKDLDLGVRLAAMARLAAAGPVAALMKIEPAVAKIMPPETVATQRLAKWLATEDFQAVRVAIARRVLRELTGPRRLRPNDPTGEIETLRALAMALTAAAGSLVPLDEVQAAFVTRSKTLLTPDFVESYIGRDRSAKDEIEALMWLAENVIGAVNKRQAGRYLASAIGSLRFEKELRNGPDAPGVKLEVLAQLQRGVARGGLVPEDYGPLQAKIGDVGGQVEADAKVVTTLARGQSAPALRLLVLLRMAAGEISPIGPAADRARAEALKLIRQDETRNDLARAPERMGQVRQLMEQITKAA
ncbi:hypothetical protein [Phenylobacterium aquaticum]|uniref:hypothetical protein n=1 Tax=Phenylobacterium aquaticum TaxID=1763816 RepID=UPI001F5D5D43|nr:hypothetical protein [Phenylobacterium aquaticum]MCI3134072.1 hypothetical protein [Phenylobacterium aquaticum]